MRSPTLGFSGRLGLPEAHQLRAFLQLLVFIPKAGFDENAGRRVMHNLMHWISSYASVLAILVTLGVAVLLVCCLECTNCPSREKDDLFRRHEM